NGRAGFSARVFAGSGKSVYIKNLGESALAEDDHPRLQISLQKLVLRPRMRLKLPNGLYWRCHPSSLERSGGWLAVVLAIRSTHDRRATDHRTSASTHPTV